MFTTRPVLRETFGVLAATDWLAAGAGMRMLESGGNAFDAPYHVTVRSLGRFRGEASPGT